MIEEINGDARLGAGDRLRYLWRNAIRNLHDSGKAAFRRQIRWRPDASVRAAFDIGTLSPGRVLAESFVVAELPHLLPPGPINVLEIGCGSGRARDLLERAGFSGHYVGIDIFDRFDRQRASAFESEFMLLDAHEIQPGPRFDLIVSNSAFEHIPDDEDLAEKLRSTLRPGGIQLHIVPAGAALWAYLWHGFRQYPRRALARRFVAERTSLYALGGFASLLVHIGFVTVPEMLFRLPARKVLGGTYRTMARAALMVDRALPFGAVMYAVCEHADDPAP